jgi:hypothetical protein
MNAPLGLNCRHALAILAASLGGDWATPIFAQAPTTPKPALPATPKPSFPIPTLHVYPDYGWLRGFNYVMPWGARIEDTWWFYDGTKMREDMALARSVHTEGHRHVPLPSESATRTQKGIPCQLSFLGSITQSLGSV